MPSTTVHLPDNLLKKIDTFVKNENISRNKFIIEACENELLKGGGQWPKDFFNSRYSQEDMEELSDGVQEIEEAIISNRRNKTGI